MKILVVAATSSEINSFNARYADAEVLITGVGAPACMYSLTKKIQQTEYDLIIQAGIAGTFNDRFPPGQTVMVQQDVYADLGIFEQKKLFTLFEKGFGDADATPFSNGFLVNEFSETFSLPRVNAITVNTITDNVTQNELFLNKYSPDIESMEGAAFHYVCIAERVRFLQLRSISNYVGERDKTKWKMKEATQNLNENLHRIITTLQNT